MKGLLREHSDLFQKTVRISAIDAHPARSERAREIACLKSHLKALNFFVNDCPSHECALILEDDVSFEMRSKWPGKSIQEVLERAPRDWQVLQLGTSKRDWTNVPKHGFIPRGRLDYGAFAYVITRKTAQSIVSSCAVDLKNVEAIRNSETLIYQNFKSYLVLPPAITYRDDNDSTIHPRNLKGHELSKNRMMQHFFPSDQQM